MPPRLHKTGHRACTICQHENRALIEAAKVAGLSSEAVAAKYGVSVDAVYRHVRNHLSEEDRLSYLADIPIKDLAAKAADEGVALLDYFRVIRGTLMNQFQLAASLNDRNATATIGRALVEVLREIGKLTGEFLNASPITNINNYAFFLNSPAFADLQAMLVRALADEPAALQKVLAGLEQLEAKAGDQAGNKAKLIEMQPTGGSTYG
jgi:hypothetical protein